MRNKLETENIEFHVIKSIKFYPMNHSLYDEVEIIRQVMLTAMPIKN
jgi:hypothetical protein